jgi:hypothetical protein
VLVASAAATAPLLAATVSGPEPIYQPQTTAVITPTQVTTIPPRTIVHPSGRVEHIPGSVVATAPQVRVSRVVGAAGHGRATVTEQTVYLPDGTSRTARVVERPEPVYRPPVATPYHPYHPAPVAPPSYYGVPPVPAYAPALPPAADGSYAPVMRPVGGVAHDQASAAGYPSPNYIVPVPVTDDRVETGLNDHGVPVGAPPRRERSLHYSWGFFGRSGGGGSTVTER